MSTLIIYRFSPEKSDLCFRAQIANGGRIEGVSLCLDYCDSYMYFHAFLGFATLVKF